MNFKKIIKAENAFNKQYGVSFSIEAFDEKVSVFDNFTGGINIDEMYRTSFSELHQKAFANFIDGKIEKTFDFVKMLKDFEETIMNPYREERKSEKKSVPTPFGGWMGSKYLESVYKSLTDIPDKKIDFVVKRYNERTLRIRDMRSFANDVAKLENPPLDKLATLYCYSEALSKVNKDRSYPWIFTHLSRFFAEKREAKNFKNLIIKAIEGKSVNKNIPKKMGDVLLFVNDDIIPKSKAAVKEASEVATISEELNAINAKVNIKEKVQINGLNNEIRTKTADKINLIKPEVKENINIK